MQQDDLPVRGQDVLLMQGEGDRLQPLLWTGTETVVFSLRNMENFLSVSRRGVGVAWDVFGTVSLLVHELVPRFLKHSCLNGSNPNIKWGLFGKWD